MCRSVAGQTIPGAVSLPLTNMAEEKDRMCRQRLISMKGGLIVRRWGGSLHRAPGFTSPVWREEGGVVTRRTHPRRSTPGTRLCPRVPEKRSGLVSARGRLLGKQYGSLRRPGLFSGHVGEMGSVLQPCGEGWRGGGTLCLECLPHGGAQWP